MLESHEVIAPLMIHFVIDCRGRCNTTFDCSKFNKLKNKIQTKEKQYLIDYIESFPLYIETEDFIVLHG